MTDLELFRLNQRGFIPGPGESERDFLERVNASEAFLEKPLSPFDGMEKLPDFHWDWVRHSLRECYDFRPDSLAAYYSNRRLAPWQGAASWVIEEKPGPLCAVQLRKGFFKGRYLGLYSRDEVLAHEAVHAARCAFQEPGYEEILAYATSSAKWRRYLGPIVKRPWEAIFFLAVLAIGAFWGNFLPAAAFLSFAFVRLSRRHLRLKKAAAVLSKQIQDERSIRAVLLRLTDREIDQLALGQNLQDDGSLRFRVLHFYFNPSVL